MYYTSYSSYPWEMDVVKVFMGPPCQSPLNGRLGTFDEPTRRVLASLSGRLAFNLQMLAPCHGEALIAQTGRYKSKFHKPAIPLLRVSGSAGSPRYNESRLRHCAVPDRPSGSDGLLSVRGFCLFRVMSANWQDPSSDGSDDALLTAVGCLLW